MEYIRKKPLNPLLKYPGGKQRELKYIIPKVPQKINRYFEPFVGGGAVFMSMNNDELHINDMSYELINLYSFVKNENEVFDDNVSRIQYYWDLLKTITFNHEIELVDYYLKYKNEELKEEELKEIISEFIDLHATEFNGLLNGDFNVGIDNFISETNKSLLSKMRRMKRIESKINLKEDHEGKYKLLSNEDIVQNIETAFKAALYSHFRYIYNNKEEYRITEEFYTAIYFFIREYCFSSMFRYGPTGNFNVPFGGNSYSKKSLLNKINHFKSPEVQEHLSKTRIYNEDYLTFMRRFDLSTNDFVFLDPPYDTEFKTYAQNEFNLDKHLELANYLKSECKANFMMVVKKTSNMEELYTDGTLLDTGRTLKVEVFKKSYFVSFKDRNKRNVEHMIITNY